MCRICRARGLVRGARDGGAPPGVAFVDASRPPEDDEIPCGFATADARSDAETSFFGADGDGPPPSPVTRVVVGAGVAGTCCAEELCRLRPRDAVVLVTAGDAVKSVRQVERVTKNVETVHIEEKPATALSHVNLSVVSNAAAVGVDIDKKVLFLEESITPGSSERCVQRDTKAVETRGASKRARDGGVYKNKNKTAPPEKRRRALAYDQLCVCAGAAPRSVFGSGVENLAAKGSGVVRVKNDAETTKKEDAMRRLAASITVVVRDVESVAALRERLKRARRVLLVGNGGIAMELADALCRQGDDRDDKDTSSPASRRRGFDDGVAVKAKRGESDEAVARASSSDDRELVWAARHAAVGDAFFDRDAAAFLRDVAEREGLFSRARAFSRSASPASSLETTATVSTPPSRGAERFAAKRARRARANEPDPESNVRVARRVAAPDAKKTKKNEKIAAPTAPVGGNAAGPDWTERVRKTLSLGGRGGRGEAGDAAFRRFRLRVAPDAELVSVVPREDEKKTSDDDDELDGFPATAILSDGARVSVDLIVCAAGVDPAPRVAWLPEARVPRGSDGGIGVDATFRALGDGLGDSVFAAGDAACCDARRLDRATRWFPMRLWNQARVSGTYAARVMVGEADADAWGFNFELFTHVTRFFGVKVILLGLYNAQTLEDEPESELVSYSRRDDVASTFARVLLLRGKMVGAVLLGDTDLEETFENLILNGTDLTRFGPSLLDPETDVGDYFD